MSKGLAAAPWKHFTGTWGVDECGIEATGSQNARVSLEGRRAQLTIRAVMPAGSSLDFLKPRFCHLPNGSDKHR